MKIRYNPFAKAFQELPKPYNYSNYPRPASVNSEENPVLVSGGGSHTPPPIGDCSPIITSYDVNNSDLTGFKHFKQIPYKKQRTWNVKDGTESLCEFSKADGSSMIESSYLIEDKRETCKKLDQMRTSPTSPPQAPSQSQCLPVAQSSQYSFPYPLSSTNPVTYPQRYWLPNAESPIDYPTPPPTGPTQSETFEYNHLYHQTSALKNTPIVSTPPTTITATPHTVATPTSILSPYQHHNVAHHHHLHHYQSHQTFYELASESASNVPPPTSPIANNTNCASASFAYFSPFSTFGTTISPAFSPTANNKLEAIDEYNSSDQSTRCTLVNQNRCSMGYSGNSGQSFLWNNISPAYQQSALADCQLSTNSNNNSNTTTNNYSNNSAFGDYLIENFYYQLHMPTNQPGTCRTKTDCENVGGDKLETINNSVSEQPMGEGEKIVNNKVNIDEQYSLTKKQTKKTKMKKRTKS